MFFLKDILNLGQGPAFIFLQLFLLLSQLARKMAAVQGNVTGLPAMLFFSQNMPPSSG